MTGPSRSKTMVIAVQSDDEILATRGVMLQLRPNVDPESYVQTVRRLMASDGFRLASVVEDRRVRAVAGYRFMETLYCGRIVYVDDLVTDEGARSRGYGRQLVEWLKREAAEHGCAQLHLDSRVQRAAAHRFYFRERFAILGFHFVADV